ncbi:MAG: hypothetical protein R3182_13950 [Draconibacterium sp.]|nr:hypothetical protein [Draconibacterium sp.]
MARLDELKIELDQKLLNRIVQLEEEAKRFTGTAEWETEMKLKNNRIAELEQQLKDREAELNKYKTAWSFIPAEFMLCYLSQSDIPPVAPFMIDRKVIKHKIEKQCGFTRAQREG